LYFRCRRPLRKRRRSFRPFHKREVAVFTTTLFHYIFKFLLKIWFLIKGIVKSQLLQKKGMKFLKISAPSPSKSNVSQLFRFQEVKIYFINYLCTYDLYSPVHNVLDACISITWGSGRGLGPGIREFFGPYEMGTSR